MDLTPYPLSISDPDPPGEGDACPNLLPPI